MIEKNNLKRNNNYRTADGKSSSAIKGNVGILKAEQHYIEQGYCVARPLNDSQPYDFIIEKNGKCLLVQVKSVHTIKPSGSRKNKDGSTGKLRQTVGNYDVSVINIRKKYKQKIKETPIKELIQYDILFVVTPDDNYKISKKSLIKINKLRLHISPNGMYKKYKVV